MLNLHPDFFVFPETHWIPRMHERFGADSVPTELLLDIVARTKHVTGLPTTDIDVRKFDQFCLARPTMTVREFCSFVGQMFAADYGKQSWADKTPDYGYFMATLQSMWPECKFIHIIRDGVAVVASMSRHIGYRALASERQLFWCPLSFDYSGKGTLEGPIDVKEFVQLWYQRMMTIRNVSKQLETGTYLELRYEQLIQAPETQLPELCSFVGARMPQDWLKSASRYVCPNKRTHVRATELLMHFGENEKQLLEELGYSARKS